MIQVFFYSFKFQYRYRKCYGTELFNISFYFLFNFHMNAGNTNICTRSVFDFFFLKILILYILNVLVKKAVST